MFEYIFEGKPCKAYFDYEMMLNDKPIDTTRKLTIQWLILNISHLFYKKYGVNFNQQDVVLTDSSDFKGDQYKFSLHIAINSNHVFKSNKDCSYIAKDLYKLDTGFDQSVYSKDRMMRCVFSVKGFNDKRALKPLDENFNIIQGTDFNSFSKYLVTTISDEYQPIQLTHFEKKKYAHCTNKKNNVNGIKKMIPFLSPDAKIEKMVAIIQDKFHEDSYYTKTSFIDPVTKYKMYGFNYLDHSDKCFTGNVHERIGFYCYIDNFANVIVKCFSAHCKNQKYIVGNLNDFEDEKGYIKINRQTLLPTNCSLDEKDDLVVKKLDEFNNDPEFKLLCFKAAMGTGKTFLMEYNARKYQPKRILLISTRQSYSNNMIQKFKEFGFVNYLEDKEWITKNRIIVQLESLHKLLKNEDGLPPFDLIILDECESILYQFSSSTITAYSRRTFKLLLRMCQSKQTKVLALDADWGIRSNLFAKAIGKHEVIYNQYLDKDRIILFTGDYGKFIKEIMDALEKGLNIVIIGLCTRKLQEISELLKNKGIKFMIHTRDTSDAMKELLKAVDEHWKDQQAVMFSPTVSVGVDFSIEHFDKIFSYVIPGTACPRMYKQMLGRIRKVNDPVILTYYENITTKADMYIYNYDEVYDFFKFISTAAFLDNDLEEDDEGKLYAINHIGLYEQIMIYNHIEDLNKCGQYFMTALNLSCMKQNYRLQFLDDRKPKEEEKGNDVYKKKIIESDDIDQTKCNLILTKINKNSATEGEKFSVHKFKIQKFWGVTEVDQAFLDTYFRKEKGLVNLKYILDKNLAGVSDEYIDDYISDKSKFIKEIVDVLGFDLTNMDIILDKDTFYENKEKLLTASQFSTNYDNVRVLFGKPKSVLKRGLHGVYLMNMLNSYLNEFGLELVCKEGYKKINGKNHRSNKYKLLINSNLLNFI